MATVSDTDRSVTFEAADNAALDALRSVASGLESGDSILLEKGDGADGTSSMKIPVESFAAYAGKNISVQATAAMQSAVDTAVAKCDTAAANATDTAAEAVEKAETAAETANTAAENADKSAERAELAIGGASARFDGFLTHDTSCVSPDDPDSVTAESVLFYEAAGIFVALSGGSYYTEWSGSEMYNVSDSQCRQDKAFICDGSLYVWDEDKDTLAEISGSGGGFYNVTREIPLSSGYYTLETAVAALEDADIDGEDKPGMIITFEASEGAWKEYRFTSSDLTAFTSPSGWEEYGGGKVKSVSLNGSAIEPDADGNVNIAIDTISVDESLDADSTNPVQNAAVTAKLSALEDAAVGGVEVIEGDEKNTLNILNTKGTVIASADFTGGSGSGTSSASRITLTCSLDKTQVKEGGSVELTYSYDHLNSDGESDGIKADITVTVKRGTTVTYEKTTGSVAAGTYTLDVSDYLLAGTVDVYVKAAATADDGTAQTKQVYRSVTVVTLELTSSYSLADAFSQGGYADGDTIEIPYTITGSGTKNISLYTDGAETPVTVTVSKSGTNNGSFTFQADTLTAGRHSLQMVAERDGILSDSIWIDVFKGGSSEAFTGVKYADPDGDIQTGGSIAPKLKVSQYGELEFQYAAYDPTAAQATVCISVDGTLESTVTVPRSQQTYTRRFDDGGSHTVTLSSGGSDYELGVEVTESDLDIAEATYGLTVKLDASGRSNTESNPAKWTYGDVTTEFSGFDWSSNGWTGDSLKLTNGAKAVIGYQPFSTDVKSTGMTLEITMRVTNINDRSGSVVSCIDNGKGLLITAEEAGFRTGTSVTYTNEDDETVSRDVKLGTNYVDGEWVKFALCIGTADGGRLMHLYVNGNRTGADIYDSSFNFRQDTPQYITIDSSEADVEIRRIRIYSRCLSDDEELENAIIDTEDGSEMVSLYDDNDILGDTGGVDIDKIRNKGKGVMRIVRENKLDDVYETNNKKTDFKADIYFWSPFGSDCDFVLKDCNIRIQGTSSTKYPSKNIRIYLAKGGESLSLTVGGVTPGENKYALRPGGIAMNLLCAKSDYSDSSMSLNTGGAKLFNDVLKELGLLTPPQRYQYEQGGSLSSVSVRTAIDGIPIDMFVAETEDGESEYCGQYNLNNEKSKSQDLFGQDNVDGYEPALPMTFETLNNTAKMCLFQTDSDDEIADIFDEGLETNYPDDVGWTGLSTEQQEAVTRLYSWIRGCVPSGADSDDISTWKSEQFASEIDQYFDKDFLLTYYLWTDYFMSVDQRAKNMLLRTWDGKIWYITYYDGDTQLGKRNDCFLVYGYTTGRDTYDAEASKYAFEGRDSWLWNLVLANFGDDLKTCAANLRSVMTNDLVLEMLNTEQSGNWPDRAFNKSGELKYITPAIQETYGKVWPYIYALQGSNTSHRKYIIENRFALLDAKYGTANFTSDNIDLYMNRAASDDADVIKVTGSEMYAFGYGTNNSPDIQNTGVVEGGTEVSLSITGAYTVNDPLRVYGASRMRTLDMTGAACHIKNGLDLGKCAVLRELDLTASDGAGSTGWWLVLSSCAALRKLVLNGQAQAKTGGSSSTELNLESQTKLEYLDARGTQVKSVVLAEGAPVSTLMLPSTLTVLRLRYLTELASDGLTAEGYDSVETLLFAGCPGLDWTEIAAACPNLKRLRVEGVSMSGRSSVLDTYMAYGGVDADGSYTDTCALTGTFRLTNLVTDTELAAYMEHFPELTIINAQYSVFMLDDTESAPAAFSNLDNETGPAYGTSFTASGHPLLTREAVMPVWGKLNTSTGVWEGKRVSDSSFTQYYDGTELDPTDELGTGKDMMIKFPAFWYKGVNDYVNERKYIVWSSLEEKPQSSASSTVKTTLADCAWADGEGKGIVPDKAVAGAAVADTLGEYSALSVSRVSVEGMAQVRFPTLNSSVVCSAFTDADGAVVSAFTFYNANSDGMFDFADGDYVFTSVPDGAVWLYFTCKNAVDGETEVVTTDSAEVEAIEPDWVKSQPFLIGAYLPSVDSDTRIRSKSGGATNTTATGVWIISSSSSDWTYDNDGYPTNTPEMTSYGGRDLMNLCLQRGTGYIPATYDMRQAVQLLWMVLNGIRSIRNKLGDSSYSKKRPGIGDPYGMADGRYRRSSTGDYTVKVLGIENFQMYNRELVGCALYSTDYSWAQWLKTRPSETSPVAKQEIYVYSPQTGDERRIGSTPYNISNGNSVMARVVWGRWCDIVCRTADSSDTSVYSTYWCCGSWEVNSYNGRNNASVQAYRNALAKFVECRGTSRLSFYGDFEIEN